MQPHRWLARFNRYVCNPNIQRLWAGWLQRSRFLSTWAAAQANAYRTPLAMFSADVDGRGGRGDFAHLRSEQMTEEHHRSRRWPDAVAKPLASPARGGSPGEAAYISSRWRPGLCQTAVRRDRTVVKMIKGTSHHVVTK